MSGQRVSIYQGWREKRGVRILANDQPLRHVKYHSPTGLEWGYSGSGPADLALSILAHSFKEWYLTATYLKHYGSRSSQAWQYHQPFKREVVAGFQKHYWMISSDEITTWLKQLTAGTLYQTAEERCSPLAELTG
jgi:hypothetical protein